MFFYLFNRFSPSYSMYLVQIISLNWLGSTVNYELDDVSCETNLTVISNELNHKCGGVSRKL